MLGEESRKNNITICSNASNKASGSSMSMSGDIGSFFFFKKFLADTRVLFGGHWYPCFGFLVTSPLGFKARVGCLIRIAEANVMYVPRDPPLVLHLLTSWRPARSQSCPHILLPAEVRLPGFELVLSKYL